jgi:uncharacterized membrane protein
MVKVLLLAAAAVLAGTAASYAELRVCNKSSYAADVSVGYYDDAKGWTSEGWWKINSGQCKAIVTSRLNNRYYYVYAEDTEGGVWGGPDSQDGGVFCITSAEYTIYSNDYRNGNELNCGAGGYDAVKFNELDVGNAADFTQNLLD